MELSLELRRFREGPLFPVFSELLDAALYLQRPVVYLVEQQYRQTVEIVVGDAFSLITSLMSRVFLAGMSPKRCGDVLPSSEEWVTLTSEIRRILQRIEESEDYDGLLGWHLNGLRSHLNAAESAWKRAPRSA